MQLNSLGRSSFATSSKVEDTPSFLPESLKRNLIFGVGDDDLSLASWPRRVGGWSPKGRFLVWCSDQNCKDSGMKPPTTGSEKECFFSVCASLHVFAWMTFHIVRPMLAMSASKAFVKDWSFQTSLCAVWTRTFHAGFSWIIFWGGGQDLQEMTQVQPAAVSTWACHAFCMKENHLEASNVHLCALRVSVYMQNSCLQGGSLQSDSLVGALEHFFSIYWE